MAGWSILANGSDLDCVENIDSDQIDDDLGNGYNSEEDHDENRSELKLRGLFDQILSHYLKSLGEKGLYRPSPPMVGNNQEVDLFRLFLVVREKRGFDAVSKKCSWGFVAEESGLEIGVAPAVKLVYYKYLIELEKWLKESCNDPNSRNGDCGFDGSFGLGLELETEFRELMAEALDSKVEDEDLVEMECDQNGKSTDIGMDEKELCFSDAKHSNGMCSPFGEGNGDNDEKMNNVDLVLNSSVDVKEKDCKRKRESFSGLLNWLTDVAARSDDPSIGVIAEPSKLQKKGGNEFSVQAIRAREVLLVKRHVDSNAEQSLAQKKLKMQPAMYNDDNSLCSQSSERLRCSKRLPSLVKHRSCTCCNSCSYTQTKPVSPHKVELESEPKEQAPVKVEVSALKTEVSPSEVEPKKVNVGPLFQADVPEWTGVVSESDSKWLGTQVWPLERGEQKYPPDSIGKGRPEFCGCRVPGSIDCVRFHIAEARMKIKRELGCVFYIWRFDRMGEEISLRWTDEEEKRFKQIVWSNMCSWHKASKWFPRKTKENLVSFYFNVFSIQRRIYQNRLTPENIDSDDDETEFISLGGRYGDKRVDVSTFGILPCNENKQCADFE
ncbi:hypothetical protein UlMin_001980 [Ulmus minor]